ncbi:hypothetical protein P3T76_001438 [Phytophthora citrophthora]|uniref:Uncharacterized protein n=1 Tax=Phytophthora citrophthora TaxID=4793 RepID=A0AAD9H020_9STRA|nr:hypothetical protein P3T76_001438 [Phytophthora citrophthora]
MNNVMDSTTFTTPQTRMTMDLSLSKTTANPPAIMSMDLAQLVETLERELGRDPELAIKHKPKLQQLLEYGAFC